MRLLVASALALLTLAPAAAQQAVEPCGDDWRSFDWRSHLGIEPGALVYYPEFAPEPASEALVARIPPPDTSSDAGSVSIAVVVVDTSGVARTIDVACSPSEAAAAEIVALIERSEFHPARDRGRPIQHFLVLPLLSVTGDE